MCSAWNGGHNMINIQDHFSPLLFDPWRGVGQKRYAMLREGWPGVFREHVLPHLPVDKIRKYFDAEYGRPSTEVYTFIGVPILQQIFDLTDKETQSELAFSIAWHYALDIGGSGDRATYLSLKTIWTARQIMVNEEIDKLVFEKVTDDLIDSFGVRTDKQRIDSTHIRSNMKNLSRVGLFAATIGRFLKAFKVQAPQRYDAEISEDLAERYLGKDGACFSRVKPSKASETLQTLAIDLYQLVNQFREDELICAMESYGLMARLLEEQCEIDDAGGDPDGKVRLKAPSLIHADSLQNPSDPDAAYDAHKGKGYQVQIMETYDPSGDDQNNGGEAPKPPSPDLITYVEVEPADRRDEEALEPAIDDTARRGCAPKQVLGDTHYGGDDNVQRAADRGIEVIAPVPGSKPGAEVLHLSDFETDGESGSIVTCPAGHSPIDTRRTDKGNLVAEFDATTCDSCPLLAQCPAVAENGRRRLRYSQKDLRLARRRADRESPEFKDRYRWRAGIEATMSRYKARLRAGRIRYRGLRAVRFSAVLNALGLNLMRVIGAQQGLGLVQVTEKRPDMSVNLGHLAGDVCPMPVNSVNWVAWGRERTDLENLVRATCSPILFRARLAA